ncbi:MAG: alpha/beta hydrolase [Steroidobacteraceae bacterium]|jgi:pimeloyl-ACP methyl ester carboxylesterase
MTTDIPVTGAAITLDDAGEGTPVLLLHGFPSHRRLWSRVAPALIEAGFRVLIPDLVGYGSRDAPQGVRVDMRSQAHWILEMLDALGIARVALVAHDVGSAAAQIIVAERPQRILGLAVLDGVYEANWAMDAVAGIRAWDPEEAHRLFPVLGRRAAKGGALREMFAAYEGREGGLRLIRAARDLDPSQTERLGDALRGSGVPALVLWGERDTVLPVDTVARPLAQLLRAPLVLLPGGHFTPLDCPDEAAAALRDFLLRLA